MLFDFTLVPWRKEVLLIFIGVLCRHLRDVVVRCDHSASKGYCYIPTATCASTVSLKCEAKCAEAAAEGAKTKLISLKRRVTGRSILGLVRGVDLLRAFMD